MTTSSIEARPEARSAVTSTPAAQRNPARRGPVLLAIDATSDAAPAVQAAQLLAQRLNVPLRVVACVEPWPPYGAAAGMGPIIVPDEEIRQAREQVIRRYLTKAIGEIPSTLEVREGRTASEFRRYAREIDATIIVMPAAPHRLFGRSVAGIRAAEVLRGAVCPVLSVPPTFTELPRLLVAAVDFSPASIRAAQLALLVAADDAKLVLVHVAPDSAVARARGAREIGDKTRPSFDRLIEQLSPFAPANMLIETRELRGEVVQQLLEHANWLGAQLVAVGTEGPGLVERMFIGSTAASVLHLARCTVLASPAPPFGEAVDVELHVRGTATVGAHEKWPQLLDTVSRRDSGRSVTLEVDDRDIGAQVEASGYVLRGVTYDPNDERVSIMLESPAGGGAHLTRSISKVDSIGITSKPDGTDNALVFKHGRGQTLLLLDD